MLRYPIFEGLKSNQPYIWGTKIEPIKYLRDQNQPNPIFYGTDCFTFEILKKITECLPIPLKHFGQIRLTWIK